MTNYTFPQQDFPPYTRRRLTAATLLALTLTADISLLSVAQNDIEQKPQKNIASDARAAKQHDRLDAALDDFNAAILAEVDALAAAITQRLQTATRSGDLAAAQAAQEALRALKTNGTPPPSDLFKPQTARASQNISRAVNTLRATYSAVSKEILKSGDVDAAQAVKLEMDEIVRDSRRWILRTHTDSLHARFPRPSARLPGVELTNSAGMLLRLMPAGTFLMGASETEPNEAPAHSVTITRRFFIGVHEVTNAQWRKVMGDPPSAIKDDTHPVESLTWDEANEFCRKLSEMPEEQAAGRVYRLPTEAEWEYACRAGTQTAFSFGSDASAYGVRLRHCAWFAGNSGTLWLDIPPGAERDWGRLTSLLADNGAEPHPVGMLAPNPWGLFDMHGNVYEYCADWIAQYGPIATSDPTGPASGSQRVRRGGGWQGEKWTCRSSCRRSVDPQSRASDVGMRVVFTEP